MLTIIAAMSENRVIGADGDLPWKLPRDMQHFMRTTRGHTVIMGRRTWESMDGPLKNRVNIVITRQESYSAPGGTVAHSLEEALRIAETGDDEEIFIIGGQAIFQDALPMVDRMYLTIIHAHIDGDTYFPNFDERDWTLLQEHHHPADESNEHAFTIRLYEHNIEPTRQASHVMP